MWDGFHSIYEFGNVNIFHVKQDFVMGKPSRYTSYS